MATILIIEDETALAELVAFHLQKDGHATIIAPDGVAGLEAARNASPDLILLDLMLPGPQGTDVCKTLKFAGEPLVCWALACNVSVGYSAPSAILT